MDDDFLLPDGSGNQRDSSGLTGRSFPFLFAVVV